MVLRMDDGRCLLEVSERLGIPWPKGQAELDEHETLAVQAARKQYFWSSMDDAAKKAFDAAMKAWQIWPDNRAVEILSLEESEKIRNRLARDGENHKTLTPRYVFTDKTEPRRTENHPLPLRARARIVVPGFKNLLAYTLRKDAPTGSRVRKHVLLAASYNVKKMGRRRAWGLMAVDIKSAFMKGEFFDNDRELYMENVRNPKAPRNCIFLDWCASRKASLDLATLHVCCT